MLYTQSQPQTKFTQTGTPSSFFFLTDTYNNEGGGRLSNAIGNQEKQLYLSITFTYH